jgi:hypothetical protein
MVSYESYSVIHGHPFPLKGRYYANIFIHFEPTGLSLCHNAKVEPESSIHHEATLSCLPFLATAEIEAKLVHDGIDEHPPGSSELRMKISQAWPWRWHQKNQKSFVCAGWEWLDPYA